MSITNLMTRDLTTLDLDSSLNDAKQIFENNKFHHIVVVDESRKVSGLITDRDLFKQLSPSIGTPKESRADQVLLRKPVHTIMTRNIVTGTAKLDLYETAFLFHKHRISCLPIVDEKQAIIGIVTWRDLLKVLAAQYVKRKS